MKIMIFIFVLITGFILEADADTVYLKNGRSMKGIINKETERGIELDLGVGTVKFNWDAIEKFERSSDNESSAILQEQESEKKKALNIKRDFEKREKDKQLVDIAINPMVELDFKTKSEIYDIRRQCVLLHPELVGKNYNPSEAVFGQIVDGKSWWGILGICYYGPGNKSIEGLSEESRFLCNPFLLVCLDDCHAHTVHDLKGNKLKPDGLYPAPLALTWNLGRTFGKVKYNLSNFWEEGSKLGYQDAKERAVTLVAYNARDLGFGYFYIDPLNSKNIISPNKTGKAVLIPHYIHCGGSSGYPGGSNNSSPYDPNFIINVTGLPAKCHIKLWRNEPGNVNQDSDMLFVMELV